MDNKINIFQIFRQINELAEKYKKELETKMGDRVVEMSNDSKEHYLIYNVLGISNQEGDNIDLYQNKGRFLYKYAGSFLEEATLICFKAKFKNAKKTRITNTAGSKPKTFEIDCLVNQKYAFEIKWRDATTDGDHITKEHTRAKEIQKAGFTPIRIMFYYPCRQQAIKIQETLKTLYKGLNGKYYYSKKAWKMIKKTTSINLHRILIIIAKKTQEKIMYKLDNIYHTDCIDDLLNLKNDYVDMIYLDPPFFHKKTQELITRDLKKFSFDDRWSNLNDYLSFLKVRLIECKRVLKKDGLIFVHCDKYASHYIKCLLDEIFGYNNFVNEIIWNYKRWSNAKKGLLNTHQNIFVFF